MDRRECLRRYAKCDRDFRGADLENADLSGLRLAYLDLRGANLANANLRGADLLYGNLGGTNLTNAELQDANLENADLRNADLRGAQFDGAHLAHADLRAANLESAELRGARLDNANLQGANFRSAGLEGASLRRANLSNTSLIDCKLIDADLLDIGTNIQTNLSGADLTNAKLRAHTVVDIAELEDRQRIRLDIHDSVADLREDYSGFWLWIHIWALLMFLAPYGALSLRATIATAVNGTGEVILALALIEYVGSAGPVGIAAALFSVVYNVLRGALLYKTHTLLLRRERTPGLPSTYVLEHDGRWFPIYKWAKRLFRFNVAAALFHGWMFLSQEVVLSPDVSNWLGS